MRNDLGNWAAQDETEVHQIPKEAWWMILATSLQGQGDGVPFEDDVSSNEDDNEQPTSDTEMYVV